MKDQVFTTEQCVPLPRDVVFAFFADPRNLEAITPPWLGFGMLERSTERVQQGTELLYKLRIHGFPLRWRSRIEEWQANERFVDTQLEGPYAKWHHTHTFHDRGGGTLIRDRVRYRLPMGWLGRLFGGRFVASDVKKIFAYRATRIQELLHPLASERR
ncbi:MAG: SRPBCC family protein [Acidobacteriota bacterium]|nr:SRPBCC family protein [Acidobacteriota bacterium]